MYLYKMKLISIDYTNGLSIFNRLKPGSWIPSSHPNTEALKLGGKE